MATIPRTYIVTRKDNLSNIDLKNGQVIAVCDNDEVWYDVSVSGSPTDTNIVRRKVSGVRVITGDTLPENPMEGIVYVYIGNHGYLPGSDPENPQLLYDVRIWQDGAWYIVGTNHDDSNVKTMISDDMFYLVGTSETADNYIGPLLKNNQVYIRKYAGEYIVHADKYEGEVAQADHANAADAATTATRATNDSKGNPITQYIKSVTATSTSAGTKLTFSSGDSSTYPDTVVTAVDTKYDVFSTSGNGLVPMPVVSASSPLSDQILFGDGWKDKDAITIGTADRANADIAGNVINTTYIQALAYDTTTDVLTVTYGNRTASISIPNTEYPNYSGVGVAGLVPPASSSQLGYFLRGDGTWQQITIVTYNIFDTTTPGLVPAPGSVNNNFLRDDHTWATPTDTKNTVGSTSSNGQLLIVGAGSQSAYAQSYTNSQAYIDNGILYSQGLQVVNLGQNAPDFDVTAAYAVGDRCKNFGVYYRCIQAITATQADPYREAPEHPDQTTDVYSVGALCVYENIIYECLNAISYPGATVYDSNTNYQVGDKCFYDGKTYSCIEATTGPFDEDMWERISEFDPDDWNEIKAFDSSDWTTATGQELYNKTYEGYTLRGACEHDVTDVVDASSALPTSAAVNNAISDAISALNLATDAKVDKDTIAEVYDAAKQGGYAQGSYCYYNDDLYRCTSAQSTGAFDPTKWEAVVLTDVVKSITVKVPEPPSSNGTYYLKAVVSSGSVTYSWATQS